MRHPVITNSRLTSEFGRVTLFKNNLSQIIWLRMIFSQNTLTVTMSGDLYLTTFSRKTLSIFTFNNFSYKFLLMTQKRGELAGGLISKCTNKCWTALKRLASLFAWYFFFFRKNVRLLISNYWKAPFFKKKSKINFQKLT